MRQAHGINNRQVGRREGIIVERPRLDPADRLPFSSYRLALIGIDTPHIQQHMALGVAKRYANHAARVARSDMKLFPEFARERGFHALARLQLTAWKLPQAALVDVNPALRNEHTPGRIENRRSGDVQYLGRRLRCGNRR